MRVVLCDDEPGYRRLIYDKILQDGFVHDYEVEVAEYGGGRELLEALDRGEYADVFFLDVQMEQGGDDGIRLGRELRRRGQDGLIVYVTGFMDYVQLGYEVKAFRYLLKSQIEQMLPRVLRDIRQELEGEEFSFRMGGETVCLDRRKILYLESSVRTLRLVSPEGEYRFYGSLDKIQEDLGEGFLRCHRSFLINLGHLRGYKNGTAYMDNGRGIPVSRLRGKEFSSVILEYMKDM